MIDTKTFVLAGDATFTITSRKTGTRYTFKVSQNEAGTMYFVSVLTGPDNWTNYKYFGIIVNGEFKFGNPERVKVAATAPSAQAFDFFWRHINGQPFTLKGTEKQVTLAECVEVHHEGKCCRCGRKLTVPSSVESGVGPECAAIMGL